MSTGYLWTIIIGGMILTYLTRLSFTVILPPDRLPNIIQRGLRFVPSAILAAIVLPELVRPEGMVDISLQNFQLIAGTIAAIVAWRTRNTWLTILVGMLALWILTTLI
jgi:branched-subunit amino acid transport protein